MRVLQIDTGVQWSYFLFNLYVCSKVWGFHNNQSITIVLILIWSQDYLWGFEKHILLVRHLVIVTQCIWAAAWESIFLEKFLGTSDYQQDLEIIKFEDL